MRPHPPQQPCAARPHAVGESPGAKLVARRDDARLVVERVWARPRCGMRQFAAAHMLQVAQVAKVDLPPLIEGQLGRQSRGVVVSVEKLIHEGGQLLRKLGGGGFRVRHREKAQRVRSWLSGEQVETGVLAGLRVGPARGGAWMRRKTADTHP